MFLKFSKISVYALTLISAVTFSIHSEQAKPLRRVFQQKKDAVNKALNQKLAKFIKMAEQIERCRREKKDTSKCGGKLYLARDTPTKSIGVTELFLRISDYQSEITLPADIHENDLDISGRVSNATKRIENRKKICDEMFDMLQLCIAEARKDDSISSFCEELRKKTNKELPINQGYFWNGYPGKITEEELESLLKSNSQVDHSVEMSLDPLLQRKLSEAEKALEQTESDKDKLEKKLSLLKVQFKLLNACTRESYNDKISIKVCNSLRESINAQLPTEKGTLWDGYPGRISEKDLKKIIETHQ